MNLNPLKKIVIGLSVAIASISTMAESSYGQDRFACDTTQMATSVHTERGSVPLIRWFDRSFPPPYTPEQRCQIVSERFRKFDNNGTLKYIKADNFNNLPILCVASYKGGSCLPDGLLVTFKPGTDANEVLLQILDRRVWAAEDTISLSTKGNLEPVVSQLNGENYVNVESFLDWATQDRP